ncbi:hypothetical protein [Cytobacillus oceanisediminis]|uniref:hypothetical protein n=1 Tax=Cytobacillus oceanisediminis TaxID=665099 RepID=UPI001C24FA6E|nr:hypothetical protein [Cytobacillus oceanisediminis]MBU8771320.1 hypothetical protein [Cytobacillus oceanisediminis]
MRTNGRNASVKDRDPREPNRIAHNFKESERQRRKLPTLTYYLDPIVPVPLIP